MLLAKHFSVACFPYPEPVYTGWSSVHWNATGMPLVNPVYTGISLGHPANTCRVHWKNLVETASHWNATGETLPFFAYTGTPQEKIVETVPHWDATGETFATYIGTPLDGLLQPPHTRRHIPLSRIASMPVWDEKMAGHQSASGQVSVNSAFTWSLLLCNGYQFCS